MSVESQHTGQIDKLEEALRILQRSETRARVLQWLAVVGGAILAGYAYLHGSPK